MRLPRRISDRLFGPDHLRADGSVRHAPEWLILVVNNTCNLKCKMCDVGLGEASTAFYTHLVSDDPRNMSLEVLDRALDQAAQFRPKPKVGLAFTEPLLHRFIVEMCRRIKERGFVCQITTNGFLLERRAEELVRLGLDQLTVSLDGPPDVHDRVRGRAGSFERAVKGIRAVNEAKLEQGVSAPDVQVSYTITDENYTDMSAFVEHMRPLKLKRLIFSQLNYITEGMADVHNETAGDLVPMSRSNLGTMNLSAIDLDRLWDALGTLRNAAGQPGTPPIQLVPNLQSKADLDTYYQDPFAFVSGRRCTDPWTMVMVRTEGSVVPAHGRCFDYALGSIYENTLTELWNGEPARTLRRRLFEAGGTFPACSRCCGVINKPKAQA
ncbi:MAG: radical SAM protein [Bacteroidota bacterium]